MVAAEVANITEQEAELYDRQIRLLGHNIVSNSR